MKSVTILVFAALLIGSSANAQSKESIVGKWTFKEIYDSKNLDSNSVNMLTMMFREMSLVLKENKEYKLEFMSKEEGVYEYDKQLNKLVMTANKGTKSELAFKFLSAETILLSFEEGKSIVLQKVPSDSVELQAAEPKKQAYISITTKELCKKWYFKMRFVPNRSEEQLKAVSEMFAGTYYEFRLDNTYTVKLGQVEESGKWELGENNTRLSLTANGETKFWSIKKVSETELEMYKGKAEEYWTFSTSK